MNKQSFILCLCAIIGIISMTFIAAKNFSNMQEYQIRIELDSAYIYNNGKLIGSCKHGYDGIDSVILKDNL